MAANYLIVKVLNALVLEYSDGTDEITYDNSIGSQPEELTQTGSDDTIHGSEEGSSGSVINLLRVLT